MTQRPTKKLSIPHLNQPPSRSGLGADHIQTLNSTQGA